MNEWPARIAVVGAGYMGSGIAEVLALAGSDCLLADISEERSKAALEGLLGASRRHEAHRLIPSGGAAAIRARVRAAATLEEASASADLVIEAVFEDREVKEGVLRWVSAAAAPDTIITTNTSSIPIAQLAAAVEEPRRFLGTHFFNPPQFVPGVEIIRSPATDDAVVERVEALLRRAGKRPVKVADTPGFVANRLQYALFQEAAVVVEEGLATAVEVDELVRSTFGFRLPFFGPFAIADMAGLDVYRDSYAVLEQAHPERFVTPRALLELIERGALGAKRGAGFVVTSPSQAEAMAERRDRWYVALERLIEETGERGQGWADAEGHEEP